MNYNTESFESPENNGSKNREPFYIGGLLLLFLLSSYLFYQNQSLKKQHTEKVETLEGEKRDLQNQYNQIVQQLDSVKTVSSDLNSQLSDSQSKLEQQKNEIERILKNSKANKSELSKARDMLATLRVDVDGYRRQIDQLMNKNAQLSGENQNLSSKNQQLSSTVKQKGDSLTQVSAQATQLAEERAKLTQEREALTQEKTKLSSKVNRAETMQAINITATGIRNRRNGKEVNTTNDKRVQKLKICFDILPNAIAAEGKKEIMLRIISPEGSTLAVQDLGSGTFKSTETGETIQYTTKANIDYTKEQQNYCMYWEQNSNFAEGTYTCELYNNGFLIGTNAVKLK